MKSHKYILLVLVSLVLFSCTSTKPVCHPNANIQHYSSQRALAEMAKGWTQEERDAFKRDFFYTQDEINEIDSLVNK